MSADPTHSSCSSSVPANQHREDGDHLLSVGNVSRRYSDRQDSPGIENISFAVRRNDITAVIGKSGSGKSTLLRLIYGLLQPDAGEVRFDGYRVPGPSEKLIPGHDDMRMVSQHFDDLNTFANVYDNVASRLSNEDLERKEARTLEILKNLRIDHLRNQRLSDLSGGEKQRVSIARALVTRPKLLLMDEPFNQVDAAFRDQLQRDLRKIVEESGLTVILVSHDPSEVMGLADQLVILLDGRIAAEGKPFDLYQYPPTRYVARMLAKSNILNPSQAHSLQISVPGDCYAVHPEWIEVSPDVNGEFEVDTVMFRGFYEELIIRKQGVYLRVYQMNFGQLKSGDRVACSIRKVQPVLDTGR
jgi:spermidine/putrescine transport system ATP-binding protein